MIDSAAKPLPLRCPKCGGTFEAGVFCPNDGTRLETGAVGDPYIGMVVSGDIEIKSVLGVGAMGTVYRARQRSIDRDVAVKILHHELSGNVQLVRRFHREAKIASRLQHPHVVEVHLVGELADGSLYIVMEFLDGSSLADALSAVGGAFPLERALGIARQMSEAVGEGHTLGIVHRDLKPENVMLVRRADVADWVKVLDFGIARLELGDQSMETAAGRVLGTAKYISPEGAAGAPVGPPGDVYALATILYQMLAGRTPFDAHAPLGLLVKHAHEVPPPLRSFAPHVPETIERVVMANLAKDPLHRAPNARAFGAALLAASTEAHVVISDVHVVSRSGDHAPVAPLAPTLHDTNPPPEVALPPPKSGAHRGWIALVVAAFVLGVVITAIVGVRLSGGDREKAAYLERTRRALNGGHYVEPPGENVNELVAQGLVRWPDDSELEQMRSEGEHEMITMAMAAHASGDLMGARYLAEGAYRLDPTDNSARYTKAQAEDELAAIAAGTGLDKGAPRLVFISPPVAKTGSPVEMTCQIVPGAAGPKAKITGMRISILPNGQTDGGTPVTLTSTDPANARAKLTAPAVGSWDVSFEASVDGIYVRAMRDLDVTP